ncbi:MAG: ribose 5-phosphate isomerase B [Chloroflexota bacterium]|nr:MAG: ribose 5-phosphate isomerase B [Chloroflexota bacterium]
MVRVAVGCDHAGLELKRKIVSHLEDLGHQVLDLGTNTEDSVDYPTFALAVSQAVVRGDAERGILVCKTGVGMCMVANKVPGIRACQVYDPETAILSREHNDANVLALGGGVIDHQTALEVVAAWLKAEFAGGRHERRVSMIREIERSVLQREVHERS